jgi:hypothetical protein
LTLSRVVIRPQGVARIFVVADLEVVDVVDVNVGRWHHEWRHVITYLKV